jgi:hypothetical protein
MDSELAQANGKTRRLVFEAAMTGTETTASN